MLIFDIGKNMIYFGIQTMPVKGFFSSNMTCAECGASEFSAFGYCSFSHIYGIPIGVNKSKVVKNIECLSCANIIMDKDISCEYRENISNILFGFRKTWFLYIPMALILSVFLFVITISGAEKNKLSSEERQQIYESQQISYVTTPKEKDIYVVDMNKLNVSSGDDDSYKYGVIRVVKVDSDTVEFAISVPVYKYLSGVNDDMKIKRHLKRHYYLREHAFIKISELKRMKENKTILRVERE
jgi:hypothetical protein